MNSTLRRISARTILAAATVLLLIGLLVAGAIEQKSEGDTTGGGTVPTPDRGQAGAALAEKDTSESTIIAPEPIPPPGEDFADGERRRRVERSASITLATNEDDIDEAAAGIARVAEQRKGYIVSSELSTGETSGAAGGEFELRVPVRELNAAMADLGDLGTVESRTQQSEDVTQGFVTTQDQLDRARAGRKSLLRRLERADSDNEAQALRRQLDLASAEVRRLQGELRRLRERTGFASIAVSLESDGGSGSSAGGVQEGVEDLTGSLLASVNIALRLLGILIPVGLLVLLFWTTYRWRGRRRTG